MDQIQSVRHSLAGIHDRQKVFPRANAALTRAEVILLILLIVLTVVQAMHDGGAWQQHKWWKFRTEDGRVVSTLHAGGHIDPFVVMQTHHHTVGLKWVIILNVTIVLSLICRGWIVHISRERIPIAFCVLIVLAIIVLQLIALLIRGTLTWERPSVSAVSTMILNSGLLISETYALTFVYTMKKDLILYSHAMNQLHHFCKKYNVDISQRGDRVKKL